MFNRLLVEHLLMKNVDHQWVINIPSELYHGLIIRHSKLYLQYFAMRMFTGKVLCVSARQCLNINVNTDTVKPNKMGQVN